MPQDVKVIDAVRASRHPGHNPVLRTDDPAATAAAGAIVLTLALATCIPAAWPRRA